MIPAEMFQQYTDDLDRQYAEASQLLMDYIGSFDWEHADYDTKKAYRDMVAEYMQQLLDTYGINAAVLASDFYRDTAAMEGVSVDDPVLAEPPGIGSTMNAVRQDAKHLWGGKDDVDGFRQACVSTLTRGIKNCADQTTSLACRRDSRKGLQVRWARVPRSGTPCAWCVMLASRGFVYYSEESARLFGSDHKHCGCAVVASFDEEGMQGYNPRSYYEIYQRNRVEDAYGTVQRDETINAIRHELYLKQRDHINEVRRNTYRRNRAREERTDG